MPAEISNPGLPKRHNSSISPVFSQFERGPDFSLSFQNICLSICPGLFLIIIGVVRIVYVLRLTRKVTQNAMAYCIAITYILHFLAQIRQTALELQSTVALPILAPIKATLSMVTAIFLPVLSHFEYFRTIHPSPMICVYLIVAAVCEGIQLRSLLLLRENHALEATSAVVLSVKIVILLLESCSKRRNLTEPFACAGQESTAGFFSRCCMWWLNGLLIKGISKTFAREDLYRVDDQFGAEMSYKRIKKHLDPSNTQLRFLLSILRSRLSSIAYAAIPRLLLIGVTYAQPFLIQRVIRYVSTASESDAYIGAGLIWASVCIYCGRAMSTLWYKHMAYQTMATFRAMLTACVMSKSLTAVSDQDRDSSGVALVSQDIDIFIRAMESFHDVWASPIEIILGIYLLQRLVGLGTFGPAIVITGSTLAALQIAKITGRTSLKWSTTAQLRLNETSVLLNAAMSIKLTGFRELVIRLVQRLRIKEMEVSRKFRASLVWGDVASNSSTSLSPFLVFTFTSLSHAGTGASFDVGQALSTFSIVLLLSDSVYVLLTAIQLFSTSRGALMRLQAFLTKPDLVQETYLSLGSTSHYTNSDVQTEKSDSGITAGSDHFCFQFGNASLTYPGGSVAILHHIAITIERGACVIVSGPSASGKTLFLQALLGECRILSGEVITNVGRIAYCCQTPWIMQGTIRQNITLNRDFEEAWYETVIRAVDLHVDFDAIPDRDLTVVGHTGLALSGGQKQRVALARAIYSGLQVLVLDDTFSGIDNTTKFSIIANLFGDSGLLRRQGTTTILASQSPEASYGASSILGLTGDGILKNLAAEGIMPKMDVSSDRQKGVTAPRHPEERNVVAEGELVSRMRVDPNSINEAVHDKKIGTGRLYQFYMRFIGWRRWTILVILQVGFTILWNLPQVWLKLWAEKNEKHGRDNDGMYIGVFALISASGLVSLGLAVGFYFVKIVPKASEDLHEVVAQTVFRAPADFFATVDKGDILSHFSQDCSLIDRQLSKAMYQFLWALFQCISAAIFIFIGARYLSISIPICVALLWCLQRLYLRTSRQLRKMDLESRPPLLAFVTETTRGLISIRAFGYQSHVFNDGLTLLDKSTQPYYHNFCIQRWLNLVLDLFVAGIAVLVVVFATRKSWNNNAGFAGLAMLNVLYFSRELADMITCSTELETSLGVIERLRNFISVTPSEDGAGETKMPPLGWPRQGAIEFENLSSSPRPSGVPIVRNLHISISPGSKVLICGRTGSGKSSLLFTILRCLEISTGSLRIDGLDLAELRREAVRNAIGFVPQESFQLPGTIRDNLDPAHVGNDGDAEGCLAKVGLLHKVLAHGGLEASMADLRLSFSENQLFSIARVMSKKPKVLLLDEAASGTNEHVSEKMERLILEEFPDSTILMVTHRLSSALLYDAVIVMDKGRAIEYDAPLTLLERDSKFRKMYRPTVPV